MRTRQTGTIDLALLAQHLRLCEGERDVEMSISHLTNPQLRELAKLVGAYVTSGMIKADLVRRIAKKAVAHRQTANPFEGVALR